MNTCKKRLLAVITWPLLIVFLLPIHALGKINLIGVINDAWSVSRHASSFIDCLSDDCDITLFKTKKCNSKDLKKNHINVLNNSVDLKNHTVLYKLIRDGLRLSGITIYTTSRWDKNNRNAWHEYTSIPNDSIINYAYCATERTKITPEAASRYNNHFDALLVPDTWLVDVYKNSGVTIPVFTLPLVLDLETLLSKPIKTEVSKPFVFGFSGAFMPRKNHELLITAFTQEFGKNPDITLRIHGRFTTNSSKIKKLLQETNNPTIEIIQKSFSRNEYEDFISSLSCYVILSRGEGFSITPREALAAGIPCIVSDNSAQTTICETGYVAAVPSTIVKPSYYFITGNNLGHEFDCDITDARKALRDVYENYQHHLNLAQQGKEWTKQYLVKNLKPKYLNVANPKKVILGDTNEITAEYIMTNSRTFFDKYRKLCATENTIFEENPPNQKD